MAVPAAATGPAARAGCRAAAARARGRRRRRWVRRLLARRWSPLEVAGRRGAGGAVRRRRVRAGSTRTPPVLGGGRARRRLAGRCSRLTGAYAERVFGTGSDEYRRVGRAGLLLLALAGFVSYAADLDLAAVLVVVAIPALTAGHRCSAGTRRAAAGCAGVAQRPLHQAGRRRRPRRSGAGAGRPAAAGAATPAWTSSPPA